MNRDNVRTSFIIPILFILLVVSIPLNESFGQTEPHEIGILKHQTTVQNNDDSYTLTSHQPYIQNSDGEWVPYILTENDSIVQVESDNLKFFFDKNTASFMMCHLVLSFRSLTLSEFAEIPGITRLKTFKAEAKGRPTS